MTSHHTRPLQIGSRSRAGFSLLELLIGMAIAGILTTAGLLSLPRDGMRAREAARVIAADLNRARSESIRLNTNVAAQIGDRHDCPGLCLYTDFTRRGSPDADLDGDGHGDGPFDIERPLLLARSLATDFPQVELSATGLGSYDTVWFDVRGLPRSASGAFLGATAKIAVRPAGGAGGYLVTLEPQGRIGVVRE